LDGDLDVLPAGQRAREGPTASALDPTGASANSVKSSYLPASQRPTQIGPLGIRYDFNHGARVFLPARAEGAWRVRLRDLDTGNILFQSDNQGASVYSAKRFYVRFKIEIWDVDKSDVATQVLNHTYDARDKDVLIQLPVGTLGDTMGWFSYVARFAETHGARVACSMSAHIIPLFREAYPHIWLLTPEEAIEQDLPSRAYASYAIGLFFDDKDSVQQPTDFRHVGLHRTAGYILGVDPTEAPPRLALPDESRPIPEPYVCIAVQSTSQAKYWNNPTGWREVVAFFKTNGYRVICIDLKPVNGTGLVWTHIPHGAEDETGNRPLTERARWLRHADCFVGLASGLSWLAWAAGAPVVLVSGFSHPTTEFATPYRVINWHTCNCCWNDPKHRFDHFDFLWCPRHANTPRQFECTRLITPEQVIAAIRRVPGFASAIAPSKQNL
jgi:autotransporter strand-loop-strand O-heptosyltransferase